MVSWTSTVEIQLTRPRIFSSEILIYFRWFLFYHISIEIISNSDLTKKSGSDKWIYFLAQSIFQKKKKKSFVWFNHKNFNLLIKNPLICRPKYLYLISWHQEFKITGFINLQQKPRLSKIDSLISSKDLGEIWTNFFFSNIVFTAMVMAN